MGIGGVAGIRPGPGNLPPEELTHLNHCAVISDEAIVRPLHFVTAANRREKTWATVASRQGGSENRNRRH